jgi:2-polyprenyl-6-methoxyphenol hydroxylase-like FAD-dependent oxidoreductase
MKKSEEVLIIGGGIAGLSASLFLDKAGIKSTIYESRSSHYDEGAGFLVSPSGVKILKSLINEQELYSHCSVIDVFRQFNEMGEETAYNRNYEDKYYGAPTLNIIRSKLTALLLKEIETQKINIRFNKKLVSIEQTQSRVKAFFDDDSQAEGIILIGADGTHSRTRASIFPGISLSYTGTWGVQGVSTLEGLELGSSMNAYFGKRTFGIVVGKSDPKDKSVLWQAFGMNERKLPTTEFDHAPSQMIKDLLKNRMEGWKLPTPLFNMIEKTERMYPRSIFGIDSMPSWSQGRVVLIGDALHATNPFTGMGASFSLEDALYLAKLLSQHDYRDAFFYFENDRKNRVKDITSHFDSLLISLPTNMDETMHNYEIKWDKLEKR